MDADLRDKFAPRRNKRYAHLRSFSEEAEWAKTLDWKTNDYDFQRLAGSILQQLDSSYREEWGLRVDQLADKEQVWDCLWTCRIWYEKEEQLFQRTGIYVFLYLTLDLWLGGKAGQVLDKRREIGSAELE